MKENHLNIILKKLKDLIFFKTDDNFNLLEIFKSRETFQDLKLYLLIFM